jgi:hypothetical protein
MVARVQSADDIDIQIAIYGALGLPVDAVAERVKLTPEQVQERRSGPKASRIDAIAAWTKDAIHERLDVEIASVDVKRRINEMSYQLIEKGLAAALDGVDIPCMECGRKPFITTAQLTAAKEGLDRTEGKALDRKSILQQHTGKVEHQWRVEDEDLRSLLDGIAHQNALFERFAAARRANTEPDEPQEPTN